RVLAGESAHPIEAAVNRPVRRGLCPCVVVLAGQVHPARQRQRVAAAPPALVVRAAPAALELARAAAAVHDANLWPAVDPLHYVGRPVLPPAPPVHVAEALSVVLARTALDGARPDRLRHRGLLGLTLLLQHA